MGLIIATGDFGAALDILSQYGPFCGLLVIAVGFFMWRDWKRELRLTKRIETLEADTRDTLIPLLRETSAVIARNTLVMERLEKHLDH